MSQTVVAIIGRANVGKSSLFNRLLGQRTALVADEPGVTRDYLYAEFKHEDQSILLVDTGGIGEKSSNPDTAALHARVSEQSLQIAAEANLILWVVDGSGDNTLAERTLLDQLRKLSPPMQLVVNKTDTGDPKTAVTEYYAFGMGEPIAISAKQGYGIKELRARIIATLPDAVDTNDAVTPQGPQIAVLGRPNVGKSTLINALLASDRVLISTVPGTTRDRVIIPFSRHGKHYTLIDTAGVRRKAKIHETVEKLSVVQTLHSITCADILLFIVDAHIGISEQDAHLLGLIVNSGKSYLLLVNKWDGLSRAERYACRAQIERRLSFADNPCCHFISARYGSGVGNLFTTIEKIQRSKQSAGALRPGRLTDYLQQIVAAHPPPLVHGRRIKLRYAHIGGQNPLRIIIHGNQTHQLPLSYQRYMGKAFSRKMRLIGTPLLIECRRSNNPYATHSK